jgi:hypothetical protein|nr:MAG TPA: hypothetical protein [Caudoviricetes sp.]
MKVKIENQIIEFEPKWSEPYEWIAINQNGVISIFTDKPTFYGNEWIEGDEINDSMETLDQKFKGKITKAWQMVYCLDDVKVPEEHRSQTFCEAFEERLKSEAPIRKADFTIKDAYEYRRMDAESKLLNDMVNSLVRESYKKKMMENLTVLRVDNEFVLLVDKELINEFSYLTVDKEASIVRLHKETPILLDNGIWHANGEQFSIQLNCNHNNLSSCKNAPYVIKDLLKPPEANTNVINE